jgi:hypothetical protein
MFLWGEGATLELDVAAPTVVLGAAVLDMQTEPLAEGAETRVLIELLPTCTSVPPGSRLRLGFSACRVDGLSYSAAGSFV